LGLQLLKEVEALGFTETDAFPGIEGEISITVYYGSKDFEFTVELNGRVTFVYDVGQETICYLKNLSLEESLTKFKDFTSLPWVSFASSLPNIMISENAVLGVLPSVIPQMALAYQSLTESVLRALAEAVVSTSRATTAVWLETILPSFGTSPKEQYPTTVASSEKTVVQVMRATAK
jgi:hypothetical protein